MQRAIWNITLVLALVAGTARAEEAAPAPAPAEAAPASAGPGAAVAGDAGGRNPFRDGIATSYDGLVDQNRQLRLQVEIAERQARLAELRAKAAAADAAARAVLVPAPRPVVIEQPKPAPEPPKAVVAAPVPVATPAAPTPRPQRSRRAAGDGEGGTRLVGFVGQAGELRALVQSGGRVVAVRAGDRLAGGTVQSIEPGRITIGGGKGRARTLTTRIGHGEIADPQTDTPNLTTRPAAMGAAGGTGGMPPALMGALGLAPAPVPSSLPPVPVSGR